MCIIRYTINDKENDMPTLSTLDAITSHQFIGNFHSDHQAIIDIHAFVDNESNSLADRATALRYLAVEGYGFAEEYAGQGVSDADFIAEYMSSRE